MNLAQKNKVREKRDSLPWRERLLARILIDDGCWAWAGWRTLDGYPSFSLNKHEAAIEGIWTIRVQRFMYETFVGPIPEGHEVDHLCHNRGCVNFDHLQAVTKVENLARRWQVCQRGHNLAENAVMVGGGKKRYCGACYRLRLKAARDERLARGHKKKGRKPKSVSSDYLPPNERKATL